MLSLGCSSFSSDADIVGIGVTGSSSWGVSMVRTGAGLGSGAGLSSSDSSLTSVPPPTKY